jgi:hypothetical protein
MVGKTFVIIGDDPDVVGFPRSRKSH